MELTTLTNVDMIFNYTYSINMNDDDLSETVFNKKGFRKKKSVSFTYECIRDIALR